jgi:hypothetical protein
MTLTKDLLRVAYQMFKKKIGLLTKKKSDFTRGLSKYKFNKNDIFILK